jgi:hypothetical protein
MKTSLDNVLYFAVLPQIVVSGSNFGKSEQVLTLLPNKDMASAFMPDEVDTYIQIFNSRKGYFIGGQVTDYEFKKLGADGGRFYVQVTQRVS